MPLAVLSRSLLLSSSARLCCHRMRMPFIGEPSPPRSVVAGCREMESSYASTSWETKYNVRSWQSICAPLKYINRRLTTCDMKPFIGEPSPPRSVVAGCREMESSYASTSWETKYNVRSWQSICAPLKYINRRLTTCDMKPPLQDLNSRNHFTDFWMAKVVWMFTTGQLILLLLCFVILVTLV